MPKRAALVLALLLIILDVAAASAQTSPPPRNPADKVVANVKSWGYQLQKVNPAEIAASPYDLVVIDYSRNGIESGQYTKAEVKAMQRKPDGSRRIVLAYLSIGEAEDYRYYWDRKWVEPAPVKTEPQAGSQPASPPKPAATVRIPRLMAPSWLGRENERWSGNYHVRFWYEGWQDIIIHGDRAYLKRIQEAGFDGVYLDRIDVFYAVDEDRPWVIRRMIDFVIELSQVARRRNAEFVLVAQNAEELLRDARYLAAINGIAKEDLLFGIGGDAVPNSQRQIAASTENLMIARAAGLPVMTVEYLDDDAKISGAETILRGRGFLPYFGPRKLDRLAPYRPATP